MFIALNIALNIVMYFDPVLRVKLYEAFLYLKKEA